MVPGHLLWSHIHAPRDAGLCFCHPGCSLASWATQPGSVCARPQGRGSVCPVPDHSAGLGREPLARAAPHTLSSHSSSFQSAQELLGECSPFLQAKKCGPDKNGVGLRSARQSAGGLEELGAHALKRAA